MTPEETLEFLKIARKYYDNNSNTKNAEALDSAIKIVTASIPKKYWTVSAEFVIPKTGSPTEEEAKLGLRYGLQELKSNWGISTILYDNMSEK